MQYQVYGFQPRNNSAFDYVFENMMEDIKLCNISSVNISSLNAVFTYLNKLMDVESSAQYGALATIGMVEFILSRHQSPSDSHIAIFEKAISLDPLKEYEERLLVIQNLQKQLGSYIKDVWNKNEYKEAD